MKVSVTEARQLLKPFEGMKNAFPFRLGTTSYIYPGEIIPNVELLGDFLDEIQLLLFEGKTHSNIPDAATIRSLNNLAESKGIAYSVHLPLDAYPGHEDETVRKESVSMIRGIYDVGLALGCRQFVFHYASRNPDGRPFKHLGKWRDQLCKSTEELLASGVRPQNLCVENLAYPFVWIADLVKRYELSICIDVGHLRVNNFPVKRHINKYLDKTNVIHLHGLKKRIDHHGLSKKDFKSTKHLIEKIIEIGYHETLILEVFQLDHLLESLKTFQGFWRKWERPKLSF
ncbi:sugar phosphate isomerase/epimerase [bacterium]|nr:sugar phosphate isomerase/epimerase [bacterium]